MKSSKRVKYYEVHVSLEIFQKKEMPNQFRKYSIRFNAKCNSFIVNKCTANRMNFVDEYVAGFCSKVLARPCMKIEHNLRNRYGISIMPITPNDQYINSCWLSMIIRNIFTVLRRPLNAVPWISVINIQCTHFISQQFTLMWLHTVHVVFIARQSLK